MEGVEPHPYSVAVVVELGLGPEKHVSRSVLAPQPIAHTDVGPGLMPRQCE
jgi:hypothetical protein